MILAAFLLGIIVGAVLVVSLSCVIVSAEDKAKEEQQTHMLKIYDEED